MDDFVQRVPKRDTGISALFSDTTKGVPSLHVPPYCWWNEALHGLGKSPGIQFKFPTPIATSFPQVIEIACSFNRQLFREIGQAISTEARAFYNLKHAGLTFWAPNINIYRDPRWGRGQETPGEDPFLTSVYATAFVRGMQQDSRSSFLKTSACCKHFAGYSQEVPRHQLDAIITKRDLYDTYFPAFQACVVQGKVSSVMCSYNAVNGFPSCANREFMTDLLRNEWKFDGYVTTDCQAIHDVMTCHHYTQNTAQTCRATLNAGVDVNCGLFYHDYLDDALAKNVVNDTMLSRALRNQVRVQMRLGMFETKANAPYADIGIESVNSPTHQLLALEAARQSLVLLKNENNTLPLSNKTLAILGPNANATTLLLSNYAGTPPFIISALSGLKTYANDIHYSRGCDIGGNSTEGFPQAEAAVEASDTTIIVIGLDMKHENEWIDRTTTDLPGIQSDFIDRIVQVAGENHPIVLVLMSGGSVNLAKYKANPKIHAILYVGYPGQAGGIAIAQTIFGDNNPSGRLSHTFYAPEFVDQVSIYDMGMRPNVETGNPGRTYRFHTDPVVYPFGFGLSYSTFTYRWEKNESRLDYSSVTQHLGSETTILVLNVQVKNDGPYGGSQSVLCFAIPPDAGQKGIPLQTLVVFERVDVQVNETEVARIRLTASAFAIADENGVFHISKGLWMLRVHNNVTHFVRIEESMAIF